MATNKAFETPLKLTLAAPSGVTITSGEPILFGKGTHAIPGVAIEAAASTNPPYDPNSGFLGFDFSGGVFVPVTASTLASPSAGAAVKVGDPLFLAGGTFDPLTGITYGGTVCTDSTGDYYGLALVAIAAGATATIPVLLKNAA